MITYNIKIQTDDEQYLKDMLSLECNIFNNISKVVFENNKDTNVKKIHHLTYYPLREKYSQAPSKMIVKSRQAVTSAYKTVKSNKHKINEPIVKKNKSMRLDKDMYSRFTNNSIDLISSIKGKRVTATFILYDKIIDMFSKYEPADPLLFERKGQLYLSVSFKVPEIAPTNDECLGVDVGVRRLFTTSEGKILQGKELQKYKRRIRYNRKQLQKIGTKSSKKKLQKLSRKEHNFTKNYCHLTANEILNTNKDVIVLEDLGKIKQDTSKTKEGYKKKSHNRNLGQVPWRQIRDILTYKAPLKGKRVVTVSPYLTSQNDCRGLEKGNRLGCRYYAVDKTQLDADINAACNIATKVSKHPTSYPQMYLVGRLLVNQPIVGATYKPYSLG